MLDLGAVGKGHAVEKAANLLRDAGVGSALIHSGTSTVAAIGHPPESDAWKIAIQFPDQQPAESDESDDGNPLTPTLSPKGEREVTSRHSVGSAIIARAPLAVVALRDEALSVSAVWGRAFQAGGKTIGHIIDPRTGEPVGNAVLSAVILPSATEADALSTALLTLGPEAHQQVNQLRPGMRSMVIGAGREQGGYKVSRLGLPDE